MLYPLECFILFKVQRIVSVVQQNAKTKPTCSNENAEPWKKKICMDARFTEPRMDANLLTNGICFIQSYRIPLQKVDAVLMHPSRIRPLHSHAIHNILVEGKERQTSITYTYTFTMININHWELEVMAQTLRSVVFF